MTRGPRVLFATALVLACAGVSCGDDTKRRERTRDENAALGGDTAVRVGDRTIPLSVVANIARVQKISPQEAARYVTDDEIAASAARARGLDQAPPTSWNLTAARARFVSERLYDEARAKGPPTDDEVGVLSERHWLEVDRPPMINVIHVVVLRSEKDPTLNPKAKDLARDLHEAVISAANADDFEAKAKAVPKPAPKIEVRVERLPAFSDEGWATDSSRMDKTFTQAAYALASIGDTSNVVESKYGWHVIRLLERLPEKRMPLETRRLAFTEEVYAMRARAAYEARLNALRAATPIAISAAAPQLTEMAIRAELAQSDRSRDRAP